jgi:hypothetical protein
MKRSSSLLTILSIALLATAPGCISDDGGFGLRCIKGEGPRVSRVLDLPIFTGIAVKGSTQVYLKQGPTQFVEVVGQSNIIDELELAVVDNVWSIEFDRCVRRLETVEIYITLPFLTSVTMTGSGDVYGETLFSSNQTLRLELTGSGSIDLAADYGEIRARTTGSGNIILEGACNEFDFTSTGSGDFRTFGLISSKGKITTTGSGNAQVFVENQLNVSITGSGDVYYMGNPNINASITGSGRLINAN